MKMKKLSEYKGKNSLYHKTLASMTATEEAAELLEMFLPHLRLASPDAVKILLKFLNKGGWKEVSIEKVIRAKKPSKKKATK